MERIHGYSYRERAVSRYSSLFTLPSAAKNYVLLSIQCIVTGALIYTFYLPSIQGLMIGVGSGIILFLATCLSNYVTCRWILEGDLILDFRRTSFLSLISNSIMSVYILLDFMIYGAYKTPNIELKATTIGVFGSLALRILVFQSISFLSPWRIGASILLQPLLFLASLFTLQSLPLEPLRNILMRLGVSAFAAFLCIQLLIRSLDSIGQKTVGIPSLNLLKAFLANWTEGIVEPIEEVFQRLSEERNVKISMIAFRSKNGMKAVIVVPSLHPGPFKNVGSSCIPSMIQEALEKKFRCIISVPHGISGHEMDLASQSENMKVLNRILKADFSEFKSQASPFLRIKRGDVLANCQIFGDSAIVILTLAPNTMEDLPFELREMIESVAEKQGLASVLTVDAHNSISGYFDAEKIKEPALNAVISVLERVSEASRSGFEVGAAKVVPAEFRIQDGMGPGGISIIIISAGGQKTAYITIDGNNMVSGLREKILSEIKSLGIDGGEVMTTDTHAVNAVVMNDLGYHPVGDAISHEELIRHIREGVKEALRGMEPAEASWFEMTIPDVKVIGEAQIDNLCMIVDEVSRRTKRNSLILFPIFTALLVLFVTGF
jgi:putative membrane protein